jgi:hypothetical protein
MKLLSDHFPKNVLEWLVLGRDERPERFVDKRLVISSPRSLNPASEPIQQIIIQTNGDPCLVTRGRRDCASAAGTEIIFLLHGYSPCS